MSILSDKNSITGEVKDLLLQPLLESSRKNRIKSIAERYGVKLTDKNTKQQMIEAALPAIEVGLSVRLKQYTDDELRLAMSCFTESEISSEKASQIMDSAPFMDGAIFVTAQKDKLFAAVPHELAGKLMMHCVTRCFDAVGSELDRCAAACAALYGSFTPKMLADAANHAYAAQITEEQAERYLASAASASFTYTDGRAVCSVCGAPAILPEAASLDWYLPTRREIEAYAAYRADSNNYYYRQIVNFIYNNTGITYDEAGQMIRDISEWCLSGGEISAVFDRIRKSRLILTTDTFNYLLSMTAELSTRTHKPCLKGHKPEDVPGIPPIVIPGIQVASVTREPVRAEQKVGRNDPCPCGSGKKYKKCCGKNK